MDKDKKVLFLRSGYGNPDSRLEKEIYALVKTGYKVEVVAWDRDADKDVTHYIKIKGVNVRYYHIGIRSHMAAGFKKNLIPMVCFNIRVFKYIAKHRKEYEVIHASDFDTILPVIRAKKVYGIKVVYDIYDYYADSHHIPGILDGWLRRVDNRIMNEVDVVIICSEERARQIKPASPKKLVVIHNTPDNKQLTSVGNKVERLSIVYIGCLIEKGRFILEMVEAISKRSDVELHIGGYGQIEEKLKNISEQYDNIIFLGKMSYEDVLKKEMECDVMTAIYDSSLINHQYAAPNKFYEALMLGKPLIVARNTAIDEVVEKECIGWVVDADSKENFEKSFNRILDVLVKNKEIFGKMGEVGKKLYQSTYSWEIMEKRLLNIYLEI